ncbi:Haemolymph juvenile hormone binding [Cinara cedri]|uniref:Haemolymph juvenile hormone binding n=1 Tax=Cinara cedri TaxID=506608 RepID=A0A5E4NTK5_9HEMI|nr:Haemolymph juvenile hormone binding [Cinara cedri]
MNKHVRLSIVCAAFLSSANIFVRSVDEYDYSDLCFRDDPKIDVCIRKRINDVVEQYQKGNDEYGLHGFDPLPLENPLHFEHKARLIGGKMSVKNMMTEGLSTIKVLSLRSKLQNPNRMEIGFTAHFRNLISSGQYQFKGYLGRMPINANGRYNITYKDVETSYLLKAKLKETVDGSFVQLESFRSYPPKFGETKIFASDLVPGNAALSRVALRFLNQYGIQITEELYPAIGPVLDDIQRDMCNKMLTLYPYDVLLPPTRVK